MSLINDSKQVAFTMQGCKVFDILDARVDPLKTNLVPQWFSCGLSSLFNRFYALVELGRADYRDENLEANLRVLQY